MLFARGLNPKQVQRWLGHHSPSFTLDANVRLLDGDAGAPLNPADRPADRIAVEDVD